MRALISLIIAFLLIYYLPSLAQELPEVGDEAAIEEYADNLSFLAAHPVNLNHASLDELMMLPGLSPYQVLKLSQYLDKHRGLSDPFVLAADSVLDREALEQILPYVCLDRQDSYRKSSGSAVVRAKRSLPLPDESRNWYDSPWDVREQAVYRRSGWEAFIQGQKDAGERSFADFYSACLQYQTPESKLKLLAGDFTVSSGQGLIMGGTARPILSAGWNKSFGLGSNMIKPYHSNDESRAWRGAAVQYELPWGSSLAAALSYRRIDADLDSLGRITAISTDGYHRDSSDLAQRDAAGEFLAGARLGHAFGPDLELGITGCHVSYDPALCDSARYAGNAGVDFRSTLEELFAAGELAVNSKMKKAGILGASYRTGPAESFCQFYGYQQGYSSPRFNALESFGGQDELGAALGNSVRLPFKFKTDCLYRLYQAGSAGSGLVKGQGGYQLEFAAINGIINGLELGWRWRQKVKEETDTSNGTTFWTASRNTSYKLSLGWDISGRNRFYAHYLAGRYRIASLAAPALDQVFCLGIRLRPGGGITLWGQSVFFNCPSYDARLYLSEPEITGSGSFHGYWGSGRRDALLVRYRFNRAASCEFKAAREERDYGEEVSEKTEIGLRAGFTW